MPEARSVLFSASARLLAAEVRRLGLRSPSFRCPPRSDKVVRSLRRFPDGRAVVAVRVRGRDHGAVVADMIEGVMVANRLAGDEAIRVRSALVAAMAAEMDGAVAAAA
jgi:hypothetical protein